MKDISLRILDMECAACVARLDRALEKLPGVQRAAVNYTAASALITYDEGVTDLAAIAARVKRAGFRVPVEEQDLLPAEADAAKTAAAADALRAVFGVKDAAVQADGTLTAYLWPIGVDGRDLAAACADAGCAVTRGELRGGDADQELEKRMDLLKTLVTSACCTAPLMLEMHPKLQFLAGTALQFGPGRYFYKSAWRGARNRTFGMDFLVSLSSTLIYLYSAYVTFTPRTSYKLYFASDGVLLSLILFGKYMEQVAAGEANSAIRRLMHLQPRTAMVQRGDTFVELPVDQIAEHDRVRIRPGERVPVDGTIVSGRCAVDESMLTGESMPVDKASGDKVIGGSLNRSGSAIVSAEALGKASVLEQIIQIVRQAQCEKAPVQRFADKVARWFVPGVIGAAALTFLVWYRRIVPRNLERALLTCCDVLSVACPCALGLATPTGLMVGSGRAAEHGILFKSGAELETPTRLTALSLTRLARSQTARLRSRTSARAAPCSRRRSCGSPPRSSSARTTRWRAPSRCMRSSSPTRRCRRRRTFPMNSAAACAARSRARLSSAAAGRGSMSWVSTRPHSPRCRICARRPRRSCVSHATASCSARSASLTRARPRRPPSSRSSRRRARRSG